MSIESEVIELITDELKSWHEIELLESKVEDMQDTVSSTECRIEDLEQRESVEHYQIEEVESTVTDLAEDVRELERKLAIVVSEEAIRTVIDRRLGGMLRQLADNLSETKLTADEDKPSGALGPNSLPPVAVSE